MISDVDMLCKLGKIKYQLMKTDPLRFFVRAFMAGAYLGLAAILSYTLGALLSDHSVVGKIAVAGTFGIGLVAIIYLGAELFTGNCFVTIMPVLKKELKVRDILPMWITCYIGNMVGIAFICFLFIKGGSQETIMTPYLKGIMEAKLHFNAVELLIRGILCNFIVCVAAYSGVKVKDDTAKLIIVMILVMTFVLPGFEHCVANGGIFAMGMTQLGNTVDWSLMPLHMLLSTIGNIIGGSVLLAVPVYMMFKAPKEKNM
ncbi:formate/nitrite transporter family protein [Longibaculum muris]|uniref:formate/nitrite transporter family protein n=1 Tax=Longibaculum muris TaxID=1796628 RepID=UPI0022E7C7D0|nr:formate/nitrite transporter family protein [Longibaculum muris]